jgi:hypothetical protein
MRTVWTLSFLDALGAPILAASLLGCASSQTVLHDPVFTRCNGSGLRDCAELTEGIVLYADGDIDGARSRLWRAGAQNSPSGLKTFAASLQALGTSPSIDGYAEPLIELAALLEMQADRAAPAAPKPPLTPDAAAPQASGPGGERGPSAPSTASARGPASIPGATSVTSATSKGAPDASAQPARRELAPALTADTDPLRLDGGVASPGTSPAKVPCGALFGAGSAYCIKATEGPFVVTDLKVVSGCPNELFVAVGSSTSPRWALLSTGPSPLAVHGGRLVVRAGEFLFVGAQAPKIEKISTDARCAVLWSGFRPYTGPAEVRAVPRDLGF